MSSIRPQDRVLDWQRRFSPRSLAFKVAAVSPTFGMGGLRSRIWPRTVWLDQGSEGACTGFGAAHCMDSTPRHQQMDESLARWFYYEARRRDEYAGEDYEGSSVLGAMEALKAAGRIGAYWWATTMDEIDHALSNYGPLEIGVDWYTGFFHPDSEGYIEPTGQIEGGHAIKLAGRRKMASGRVAYTLHNSWGKDWGLNGAALMWQETMAQLLSQRGEFALPRKIKGVE